MIVLLMGIIKSEGGRSWGVGGEFWFWYFEFKSLEISPFANIPKEDTLEEYQL